MGWLRELNHGRPALDFPKMWRPAAAVSLVFIVLSLGALVVRSGLNLGIDFVGGTVWEVEAPDVSVEEARDFLRPLGESEAKIQIVDGTILRIQSALKDPARAEEIQNELTELGTVQNLQAVGPTWGREITNKALIALVVFFVLLALYIWWRLEWRMAVGALVAVAHDVFISVGVYAILDLSVTPPTVVAFLTILGYSLYDTVVVFDKVRELTSRPAITNRYTYTDTMNLALNQVFIRSMNTTLVAVIPVAVLIVMGSIAFGAKTLQEFAVALFVGLIVGAYSSVFIATPVVAWLKEKEPRHRDTRARLVERGQLGEGTVMINPRDLLAAAPAGGGRPTAARPRPGTKATAAGRRAAQRSAATPTPAPRPSAAGATTPSASTAASSTPSAAAADDEIVDAIVVDDDAPPAAPPAADSAPSTDAASSPDPAPRPAGAVIPPRPRKKKRR